MAETVSGDKTMNRTNRKGLLGAAVLALVATAVLAAPSGNTALRPIDAYASLVGSKGEISFPKDFPNGYIFIGTWAVAGGDGVADVHSVYSRPQDVAQFRQTGKWPDGAVIIKEVSSTIGAPHTTGKAFWANETQTWFLMVKDTQGRFKANPLWGDGWGWAQFDPKNTGRQIATNYKTDCQGCHVPVRANDWIYTYAYPSLGPQGQKAIPSGAIPALNVSEGHRVEQNPAMNETGRVAAVTPAMTEARAAQGKVAFEATCSGCHSAKPGENGTGPSMFGVLGRKAGSLDGYGYSPAMSGSSVIWSAESLDKHLADTKNFIPGNRMGGFFAGVEDQATRSEIIAYLATLK